MTADRCDVCAPLPHNRILHSAVMVTRLAGEQTDAERRGDRKALWYFSFVDPDRGFLGGAFVRAETFFGALTRSHELGINPGGEVAGWEWPEELEHEVAVDDVDRLLDLDELRAKGYVK